MHDIYDPPPAPDRDWTPPEPERLVFTTGDLVCLMGLCAVLFTGSVAGVANRARAGPGHGGGRDRW